MKKVILYIYVIVLMIVGFWFRYVGIEKNLSFWNDENNVAIYARGLVQTGSPVNAIGKSTGLYQIALYYVTAASYKLFGITEFAARLPSVLIGTLLIGLIFFITKKVIGMREAVLAAFLMTFSQMQLAWSTQLRPYIWLEFFVLTISYFCYRSFKNDKRVLDVDLILSFILALVATLFHGSALMTIAFPFFIIIVKAFKQKNYKSLGLLLVVSLIFLILAYLFGAIHDLFFRFNTSLLHYRIYFTQNYKWLILGVVVGCFALYKKNIEAALILSTFTIFILFVAIFKINSEYVRYSVPAFALMYMLFSAGVFFIVDILSNFATKKWFKVVVLVIIVAVSLIYPIKKQKLLFKPKYFYTINWDIRENPIVDYKSAFEKIKQLSKGKKDIIYVDAWNDRFPWYMPGKKFIFVDRNGKGQVDPGFGEKMIGTTKEFEQEKKKYKSGIVLVENWESRMPPDVQEYIRTTLKKQFDVENLPYNESDKWSISVYSWGI